MLCVPRHTASCPVLLTEVLTPTLGACWLAADYALDDVKTLPVLSFAAPGEVSGEVTLDNRCGDAQAMHRRRTVDAPSG